LNESSFFSSVGIVVRWTPPARMPQGEHIDDTADPHTVLAGHIDLDPVRNG
jgi:hypothetical protein